MYPFQNLHWLRSIGDTVFAPGALILAWFMLGLITGRSYEDVIAETESRRPRSLMRFASSFKGNAGRP